MSISDIYSSGAHKKNIGHFASIVKLAIADDVITEGEQQLLERLAKRLNITKEEHKKIVENPDKHPINPPAGYDARIERLYNLTKMVFADNEVSKEEVSVMHRVVIGLGFPQDNAEKISDEALHLVMNDNTLEDFIRAIKRVNRE